MQLIVLSVIAIVAIGFVCGIALALGARYFSVEEDPRVAALTAFLPGANCGSCGFAGCAAYAAAIVAGTAAPDLCPVNSSEGSTNVRSLLGLSAEQSSVRRVAHVLCGGDNTRARKRFAYDGITDCAAAQAVGGGDKACTYGCLGYGSCVRVCPASAITVIDGLARIDQSLCISCRKCVEACPRHIIHMVPDNRHIHVLCSSKDTGAVVRKVCEVGCIGCRICVKLSDGAISMDGALAVVDYSKPLENEIVIEKCPGKCIRKV